MPLGQQKLAMSLLHEVWSASQVSSLAKMRVAGRADVVEAQRAVMSRTRKGAGSLAKIISGFVGCASWLLVASVVAVDVAAGISIVVGSRVYK